jgi:hypothetical protein
MTSLRCTHLRVGAGSLKLCLALLAATLVVPAAWAHTDPPGSTLTGVGISFGVFSDATCTTSVVGQPILECQTVYLRSTLQWQGGMNAAFEAGRWRINAAGAEYVDLGAVPCIGGTFDDPNSAANNGRGLCAGAPINITSACVAYTPTAADIAAGSVQFNVLFGDLNPGNPDTAFAHLGVNDLAGVSVSSGQILTIDRCDAPETACLDAEFCDPGPPAACVQNPKALSTACELDGDLCTVDHCDGLGVCVQESLVQCGPGDQCFGEQCNPATGSCDQINEPLSTECELDGSLCTNDHCDGAGVCVQESTVQCPDAEECRDFECNPGTGECDANDFELSTSCETDSDLCTTQHCDGSGTCIVESETQCATGDCFTEECNPGTGECDRTCVPGDPESNPECWIQVGDFIWQDDNDGEQEAGEPGIGGIGVDLLDCNTLAIEDGTTTNGSGIYGLAVEAIDANCEPETRDLKIQVDLEDLPGGYTSTVQNFGGPEDVDSDCDPTGMSDCFSDLTAGDSEPRIDCGYVPPDVTAICRTPGFWGARGDGEKGGFNYTQAAIDGAGGCLNVCGVDICGTDETSPSGGIGNLGSALEAMCVNVGQDPQHLKQVYRQATAAALNCSLSGAADCGAFLDEILDGVTWEQCNDNCALGGDSDKDVNILCAAQLDCFNNGGQWTDLGGFMGCALGTCSETGDLCGGEAGECPPAAGPILGAPPSEEGAILTAGPSERGAIPSARPSVEGEGVEENVCVPFAGNCHDTEICESPLFDPFDGQLPEEDPITGECRLGPASSPRLCQEANQNDCTILGSCDPNPCEGFCSEP